MIPILWETAYIITGRRFNYNEIIGFLIANVVFTLIYIAEFSTKVSVADSMLEPQHIIINHVLNLLKIIQVIGFGCANYWSSKWNILDAVVLIVTIAETALSLNYFTDAEDEEKYHMESADTDFLKFIRFVRIARIARVLRLFRVRESFIYELQAVLYDNSNDWFLPIASRSVRHELSEWENQRSTILGL
jgi:hypothetical protein